MSGAVSELDLVGGFGRHVPVLFLLISTGLFCCFALKQLTGRYSILQVLQDYKDRKRLDERYTSLFDTRDSLCYHIGAARSRGESVGRMADELRSVDEAITLMEMKQKQTNLQTK